MKSKNNHNHRWRNWFICIALLSLTGCGTQDFTPFAKLGGLRMTAIQVEDVGSPGVAEIDGLSTGTVTMRVTPFISDLQAEGRSFQVQVRGCIDPGLAQGAGFICPNPQVIEYPNGGLFDTSVLTATRFTGPMTPFDVVIENPAALIADRSETQKFNGVNYILVITLVSDNESLTAIKAIPITTRLSRNRNPEIDQVLLNGSTVSSGPTQGGPLKVLMTTNGLPESFEEMDADGRILQRVEDYLITWFFSEGRIRPFRTVEGQNPELVLRTQGPVLLKVVVRDSRGGVDVRVYQ